MGLARAGWSSTSFAAVSRPTWDHVRSSDSLRSRARHAGLRRCFPNAQLERTGQVDQFGMFREVVLRCGSSSVDLVHGGSGPLSPWPVALLADRALAPVLRGQPSHGDQRHRAYQKQIAWHLPSLLDTAPHEVPMAKGDRGQRIVWIDIKFTFGINSATICLEFFSRSRNTNKKTCCVVADCRKEQQSAAGSPRYRGLPPRSVRFWARSRKRRLVIDFFRSGVNGDVAHLERVVLPRSNDLTRIISDLQPLSQCHGIELGMFPSSGRAEGHRHNRVVRCRPTQGHWAGQLSPGEEAVFANLVAARRTAHLNGKGRGQPCPATPPSSSTPVCPASSHSALTSSTVWPTAISRTPVPRFGHQIWLLSRGLLCGFWQLQFFL